MSDVSDEDATRILATSPQQVVRVVLMEFGERHDTRTNGQHYRPTPQQIAVRPITQARRNKLNGDVALRGCRRVGRVGEYVTQMLRGNCSRGIPASATGR